MPDLTLAPTHTAGEARITRLDELLPPRREPLSLLPDWDAASLDADALELAFGPAAQGLTTIQTRFHAWLLQAGGQNILIDAGLGNGKERPGTPFQRLTTTFLAHLAALDVTPDMIGHVLITHMHHDHVGWCTRLIDGRWVPTFPNARYVFSAPELAACRAPGGPAAPHVLADSIQPVLDAGLAVEIGPEGGQYLDGPGLRLSIRPTPGHTAGHVAFVLESAGSGAVFMGDIMHHPVQVRRPDWTSVYCVDPVRAYAARRWLLEYAADRDVTVFTGHFAESSAGRITRQGDGFAWTWL